MGRFSTVCFLLFAACGDNSEPLDIDLAPVDGVEASSNTSELPRYVPAVCASKSWTTDITESMNISVTTRPGAVITLATPRTGGSLRGFVLDTRMEMTTMNKPDIAGAFSAVSASYQGERVVSTAVADNTIVLHLLDDNLENAQYTTKMQGRFVADPAFFHTQSELVVPTAGDDGVWLHRFGDWADPIESKRVMATDEPAIGMTAAQLGVATMLVASTEKACHMMLTSTFSPGLSTTMQGACDSPRIAVGKNYQGIMVFDSEDGVRLSTIDGTHFGGNSQLLRPGTSAPRALFDGTNYWVSYLDERGDVIVGFLDKDYHPATMSLAGPRPDAQAYELVLVNGSPVVIALDDEGYSVTRMCVDAI